MLKVSVRWRKRLFVRVRGLHTAALLQIHLHFTTRPEEGAISPPLNLCSRRNLYKRHFYSTKYDPLRHLLLKCVLAAVFASVEEEIKISARRE